MHVCMYVDVRHLCYSRAGRGDDGARLLEAYRGKGAGGAVRTGRRVHGSGHIYMERERAGAACGAEGLW